MNDLLENLKGLMGELQFCPEFDLILGNIGYENEYTILVEVFIHYPSNGLYVLTNQHKEYIEEYFLRLSDENMSVSVRFEPYETYYKPICINVKKRVDPNDKGKYIR